MVLILICITRPPHTNTDDDTPTSPPAASARLDLLPLHPPHPLDDRPRTECPQPGPGERAGTTAWNRSAMAHHDEATHWEMYVVRSEAEPG